jgi:predicted translation initiation factor SUI1
MPTLKDLLGENAPSGDAHSGNAPTSSQPDERASKPRWKTGYDGNVYVVKVRTEKRRGKTVTIAWNFQAHPKDLHDLLALCKKKLGTGGQVTDNALELQGDHVEKLKGLLMERGFKVPGA